MIRDYETPHSDQPRIVKTVTSDYGSENSWSLGTCNSEQTYVDGSEYFQVCCLDSGLHTLTCKDSWGDGWKNGEHGLNGYLEIDGVRYCEDFSTGFEKIINVSLSDISGRILNIDDFNFTLYCWKVT